MIDHNPDHLDSHGSHGSPDSNVNELCDEFVARSNKGFIKYKTTTADANLSFDAWLQHFKEELQDALIYIHAIQQERKK